MSNRKLPIVSIVGRTNAGKSSIFNRLVGRQDAIVAREAGTTRDSASIQDQVDDAIASADLILLMKDSTEDATQDDRELAKRILKSGKPVILILNKIDLAEHFPLENFLRLGIKDIIQTSAEHNQGIGKLSHAIMECIPHVNAKTADDRIKVALIGRPNAGKSYLFNTLAGKQQAMVANVAGTTRDVNRIDVKYHGKGKIEQGIERFSVLRTISAIEEADICLLLMDVNELNTSLDTKLAGEIIKAGKGLVIVVSKWDSVIGKDAYTRDALAPYITRTFDFAPWAPLIFTSSTTGQNVAKIYDLIMSIDAERHRTIATSQLNDCLHRAMMRHKPAGLYVVQTDVSPPWFVIYGSNLKYLHWSYKRYLEAQFREAFGFNGTPVKFSFRDEKQLKANRERLAAGKDAIDNKSGTNKVNL